MNNRDLFDLKNKRLEQVKFNEIMNQTNIGNLDKAKVIEVLETIPNIVELQRTYLNSIKDIIDAAKIQVEICLNPEKGIALYAYAKKLLERFICKAY